ncbi:pentatricopeptide repeat-containing protein At3g03580-like [Curcuma longa]|uniref:pentatricopeptide repeat-containing protein At3g03580-like n=1 Tax=Curcuma longa TaxID=136217 RepID=UPI003D9F101D
MTSLGTNASRLCYRPNPQALKEALAGAITRCASCHRLRFLHGRTIAFGFRRNLYLSSLLLSKYFHFADASTARLVFDDARREGPTKTLLWNSLIKGYLKRSRPCSALDIYHEMVASTPPQCDPDRVTFHLVLTACSHLAEFELGCRIGAHARVKGLDSDLLVATALVDMYCKAGVIDAARRVFDGMLIRDVIVWNAMISGYSKAGLFQEAVNLFRTMRLTHGIFPSEATIISLMPVCCYYSSPGNVEGLHILAIKLGLESSLLLLNALLEMYVNCNNLIIAISLFNRMENKDPISLSTMIGGYVQHKKPYEALKLFNWMVMNTHVCPSRSILINVILACAELGDWKEGKLIQDSYLTSHDNRIASDSSIVTVLAYMYAKCGMLNISLSLLDPHEEASGDVVTWNAMMKACSQIGMISKVFYLMLEMQRRGISPDHVTFVSFLSDLCCTPILKKITETHSQIIKRGFEIHRQTSNCLINAYAKCGSITDSSKIFNGIIQRDVVSWSTMIQAYAWDGKLDEVLDHFEQMRERGIMPNHFTFLSLLSACSHVGLVQKGWEFFNSMKEDYNLEPGIEHLTCMVDMLCRAARLPDAYNLVKNAMQRGKNCAVLWGALLSACRVHGNVATGEEAARHLYQLEPQNVATYKMLADVYIAAGRRGDVNGVLSLMCSNDLKKVPGFSWYEDCL